ncbi:MAG: hypothetical protein WCT10_03380 [Patescibacteria group bacterium]|jgi:hypothetical protein
MMNDRAALAAQLRYWGAAAFLFALVFSLVGLLLPPALFSDGEFFDSGLRLLRDEQEMRVYFERGQWLADGGRPYSAASPQEYPPAGVLFLALPRLFTSNPFIYQDIFALLTSILFGLLVWLTGKILISLGRPLKYLWLFFLPGVIYFSVWRFDILPAVLVAAAAHEVIRGRRVLAALWLILGGLVKFYPAFFLLPLLMLAAQSAAGSSSEPGRRRVLVAAAAAPVVLLGGILIWAGPDAFLSPILFHLGRTFEIGSLGDISLWAASFLGGGSVWFAVILAGIFSLLQFIPFIFLLVFGRIADAKAFIRACLFLLLPFMLFNRFVSPQWVVWFIPLAVLVSDKRETVALVLLGLTAYLQFPILFGLDPFAWTYKFASGLLLAVIAWLAWQNLIAMKRDGALVFAGNRKIPLIQPVG